jgi:hypothetical protein
MKANLIQKIAFIVFVAALALLLGGIIFTIFTSWWGLTATGVMLLCWVICHNSGEISDFIKRTVADIRDNIELAMQAQKPEA